MKLISAGSIGNLTLKGKKGYIYGEEELDAISSIYGKGKGAISSRSVKDYDINEVTGYDPKKTGKCSAKELFHALKVVGEKLTNDDIQYIQSKIEIDQNGNIDYNTFVEILTQ